MHGHSRDSQNDTEWGDSRYRDDSRQTQCKSSLRERFAHISDPRGVSSDAQKPDGCEGAHKDTLKGRTNSDNSFRMLLRLGQAGALKDASYLGS